MAFYNSGALNRAANAYNNAIGTWRDVNPDATIQTAQDAYQNLDQTGKDAQEEAMRELQAEYQHGGMDTQAKAALQEAQASNAQQARGATDAALERAQAEGRLNSGRALSAQIQAEQNATNANAMAGTEAAGEAANRGQQALLNSAQVGGNLTGQAQQTAAGQNQAAQFNTGQQNQGAEQNVQNEMMRAGGLAGAQTNLGNFNSGRAQQADQMAQSFGTSLIGGLAGMGGAALGKPSDARLKEDIAPTGKTIDGVPEKTFKYKDDPTGQPFKGVIAQDVEKVRPKDVVKDERGVRHVTKAKDKPKKLRRY